MNNETLLAIETSTPLGSLALLHKGNVSTRQWHSNGSHSEVITNELEALLTEAGSSLEDINKVICGSGPGSFTGIRIGLNLAKSLCYSLDIPVYSFNTFQALLAPQVGQFSGQAYCLVTAFRNLIYCAGYQVEKDTKPEEVLAPSALTAEELLNEINDDSLLLHNLPDLSDLESSNCKMIFTEPLAENFIQLYKHLASELDPPKDWKQLTPLYVRASEAEEKLKSN